MVTATLKRLQCILHIKSNMEKTRLDKRSNDAILGDRVQLLTTVIVLLTRMSGVSPSFIEPGQEGQFNSPNAAPSKEGDGGLEAADIVAIVLGVLLLLLIIVTIIVCVLIKKGKIFAKEDTSHKVAPAGGLLNGFTTTSERMKDCSFRAMTKDKSLPREKPRDHISSTYTDNDSIIYMYDDIYHPPDSRPLPNNNVRPEPYVAEERVPTSRRSTPRFKISRDHRSHRDDEHRHSSRRKRSHRHRPRHYSHSAPTPPPTPEPETDLSVIPTSGRFNITTSGRSPYVNHNYYGY